MSKEFIGATATLIGTIVGVGVFGMPYAMARSGFFTGLFFLLFLGFAILAIHLIYGEVCLRTNGKHHFVGYAEIYLGHKGKIFTGLISILMRYGALLAYTIVAGKFLRNIFGGGEVVWSLVFFVAGAVAVFFGLKIIGRMEVSMALLLFLVIAFVFFKGIGIVDVANFSQVDWRYFFLPYGVVLWAVGGMPAIPEMKQILRHKPELLKKAIVWATLIPIFLYAIFISVVVGITGTATTKEAILGLEIFLGEGIVVLGSFFGLLAVMTSFLVLGVSLRQIFWYDFGLNKYLAWFLVCLVPLFGYLLNLRDFILVISFIGAVLSGLEAIVLIVVYQKAKKSGQRNPEYKLNLPRFIEYGLALLFIFGIIYQIFYYL